MIEGMRTSVRAHCELCHHSMRRSCSHCLHQTLALLSDFMSLRAFVCISTMLLRTYPWRAAGACRLLACRACEKHTSRKQSHCLYRY